MARDSCPAAVVWLTRLVKILSKTVRLPGYVVYEAMIGDGYAVDTRVYLRKALFPKDSVPKTIRLTVEWPEPGEASLPLPD